MEDVGTRLKAARNELGITLQELADRIDYSTATISNAENGNDKPGRRLVLRIVEELGLNEDWLRTGNGGMFTRRPDSVARRAAAEERREAVRRIQDIARNQASRSVLVRDSEEMEEKLYTFDAAAPEDWTFIKRQIEIGYQHAVPKKGVSVKTQKITPSPIIEFPAGHQLRAVLGDIAAGLPQEAIAQADKWIALPPKESAENAYVLRARGDSMIDKGIYDGDLLRMSTKKEPKNGSVVAALCDHETTLKTYVSERGKPPYLKSENKKFPPSIEPADELVIQGVMIGKHPAG